MLETPRRGKASIKEKQKRSEVGRNGRRSLVVSEFITLDGIIENPGGSEDSEHGGWSFRHPAPEGQQFKFDELQAADVQLLGRVTYQGFATAWPDMEESTGEFGKKMNAMPKLSYPRPLPRRRGTTPRSTTTRCAR